jgi:hypothetical protein
LKRKKTQEDWGKLGREPSQGIWTEKVQQSKPLHPDASWIWKKAIVKYKFEKPMKCPKVDCGVKSQSDDGCDQNKSEENCNPWSEAVSLEEEGGTFLVLNDI